MRSGRCDKCNALLPLDGGACLDCSRNVAKIEKSKISPRKRAAEQLRTGDFEPSNPRVKKSRKLSKTSKILTSLVTGAIALGGIVNWFSNQDFSPTPPPPPVVRTDANGHCEKAPKLDEGFYWIGYCIGNFQGYAIAGGNFDLYLDEDASPKLRNVSASGNFFTLVCETIDYTRESQYDFIVNPADAKVLKKGCKEGISNGYNLEHKRLLGIQKASLQSPRPKPRASKPNPVVNLPRSKCTTRTITNPNYDPSHPLTDERGRLYGVQPFLTEKICS